MITRRAALGLVAAGLAAPALPQGLSGLRLADFGGHPGGEDASDAFARALDAAAQRGAELLLGPGTTLVATPPGMVLDAADHAVPAIRHARIHLRGAGAARTRLICRPRPGPANPALPVSAPLLKSVGAESFTLEGMTLDGAIGTVPRGLRQGPDPHAAALLEVREARHCRLRDVVFTGFAGHWDTRAPYRGAYGRRGPLLIAQCEDVELLDVTLRHPTWREGLFLHSPRRALVRGFRLQGPPDMAGLGLSSPLNIMGPQTGEVLVEDLVTEGAWSGSLLNLGGPGRFTVRRLRAQGAIGARTRPAGGVVPPGNWGKGIDIGAEINDALFPGQAATQSLHLEDILLRDLNPYAIRATRRAACPLGRLSLGAGVRVEGGFEALGASHVGAIEGRLMARRMLAYQGERPGGIAVSLLQCLQGRLELDIAAAGEGLDAGLGVLRVASGGLVLGGQIAGFAGGGLRDEVRLAAEDAQWDARCEGLAVTRPAGSAAPGYRIGRDATRRVRLAALRGCRLDGVELRPGLAGFVVYAQDQQIG
jgi:hypothetical protein